MRRLTLALALAPLLAPVASGAESGSLLAKIEAVAYVAEVSDNRAKDCAVDLKDVLSTIKFYGNESRLRWYELAAERARLKKEAASQAQAPPPPVSAGEGEWQAWLRKREELQRVHDRSYAIPLFHMTIYPAKMEDACMAFVHVGLSAPLRGARIAHSGVPFNGNAEIWDEYYYLKGDAGSFAAQVRDAAERAVKNFVNDWSDANR
ncbi:MAG: hypothetical protein ACHQRJ_05690 [Alphaproteobacteria bacterium]